MIKLTIHGKPYYLSGDIKQEQDVRREILRECPGDPEVVISENGRILEIVKLSDIFKR